MRWALSHSCQRGNEPATTAMWKLSSQEGRHQHLSALGAWLRKGELLANMATGPAYLAARGPRDTGHASQDLYKELRQARTFQNQLVSQTFQQNRWKLLLP